MGFNLDKGGGSGKDFNLAKGDSAGKEINLAKGGGVGSTGRGAAAPNGGDDRVGPVATERKRSGAFILGTAVLLAGAGWFFFGRPRVADGGSGSPATETAGDSSSRGNLAVGAGGADSAGVAGAPSPVTTPPAAGLPGTAPATAEAAAATPSSSPSGGDSATSNDKSAVRRPSATKSIDGSVSAATSGVKPEGTPRTANRTATQSAPLGTPGAGGVADGPRRTAGGVLIPAYFGPNSSLVELVPANVVAEIKTFLAANANARVSITGHASSDGDPQANLALSVRRAEAFKVYLATEGVDVARVDASGRGAESPIASNDTASGRARNRRIEVRF